MTDRLLREEDILRLIPRHVSPAMADELADAIAALPSAPVSEEREAEMRQIIMSAVALGVAAERKGLYKGSAWAADAVMEEVTNLLRASQQTEPTDEQLEAMVEAYEGYQSPADQGLAQQMEGMRLALKAARTIRQGVRRRLSKPAID